MLLIIFIEGSFSGGVYLFTIMDVVSQYKHSVTSLSTYPPRIVPLLLSALVIRYRDLGQNVRYHFALLNSTKIYCYFGE